MTMAQPMFEPNEAWKQSHAGPPDTLRKDVVPEPYSPSRRFPPRLAGDHYSPPRTLANDHYSVSIPGPPSFPGDYFPQGPSLVGPPPPRNHYDLAPSSSAPPPPPAEDHYSPGIGPNAPSFTGDIYSTSPSMNALPFSGDHYSPGPEFNGPPPFSGDHYSPRRSLNGPQVSNDCYRPETPPMYPYMNPGSDSYRPRYDAPEPRTPHPPNPRVHPRWRISSPERAEPMRGRAPLGSPDGPVRMWELNRKMLQQSLNGDDRHYSPKKWSPRGQEPRRIPSRGRSRSRSPSGRSRSRSPLYSPHLSPIASRGGRRSPSPSRSPLYSPRASPSPSRDHIRSPVRRGRTPTFVPARARSPIRSPVRSPARSPVPSPVRSSIRSPVQSPIQNLVRNPVRRGRTPTFVPARTRSLVRSRSRSPVRGRTRSPVRDQTRSPARDRGRSYVRGRTRSPVRGRTLSPVGSQARSSVDPKPVDFRSYVARLGRSRSRPPNSYRLGRSRTRSPPVFRYLRRSSYSSNSAGSDNSDDHRRRRASRGRGRRKSRSRSRNKGRGRSRGRSRSKASTLYSPTTTRLYSPVLSRKRYSPVRRRDRSGGPSDRLKKPSNGTPPARLPSPPRDKVASASRRSCSTESTESIYGPEIPPELRAQKANVVTTEKRSRDSSLSSYKSEGVTPPPQITSIPGLSGVGQGVSVAFPKTQSHDVIPLTEAESHELSDQNMPSTVDQQSRDRSPTREETSVNDELRAAVARLVSEHLMPQTSGVTSMPGRGAVALSPSSDDTSKTSNMQITPVDRDALQKRAEREGGESDMDVSLPTTPVDEAPQPLIAGLSSDGLDPVKPEITRRVDESWCRRIRHGCGHGRICPPLACLASCSLPCRPF
ncbi:hypothetical protein DAEQUDRAFT_280453 [Daedalea quercina L-15889]|uniref:Uncharacterized protein n=1 Tax=Daedalea quercina L-15889 TaxID=1314783 RepID=A0A165Q922_9APHY|nr:hypothetical protein DAEQUDRAFT_280453 [Daedalea quercina L-15889]